MIVNSHTPLMFNTNNAKIVIIVFENYETVRVQDQALFTWLLSTISEVIIPCGLLCKHTYAVWTRSTSIWLHLKVW